MLPTTCARCGASIRPNQAGGWFSQPANHLANTCDGVHLHRPVEVVIAAGNGANSGRTAPLLGTEVHPMSDEPGEFEVGVVEVDGIHRRYLLSSLTPAEVAV